MEQTWSSRALWLALIGFGVATAVAFAGGCSLVTPFLVDARADAGPAVDGGVDGDVDRDGGDARPDGDADFADGDGESETDGDLPAGGASMTYVIATLTVIAEPRFDLDGDGELDNAVAALGAQADLFAAALSALFDTSGTSGDRQVSHAPWVDDVRTFTDPSLTFILFRGVDTDDPPDPLDDLEGDEPFYARALSLDGCGEPRYYYDRAVLDEGWLEADSGTVAIPISSDAPLVVRNSRSEGSVDGEGANLLTAGVLLISDLGAATSSDPVLEGHSVLEMLVGGGAAFGAPMLLGLAPDLDLDDDGLEWFEVDDEGFITRCVDGDRTVIEGRSCWTDEAMADGFSFTLRWEMVTAAFAGKEPGWERYVPETCETPPEQSRWDPR